MPAIPVRTHGGNYAVHVERGSLARLAEFVPEGSGKLFIVTTGDVWKLHQGPVLQAVEGREHAVLFFPGGEDRKRLAEVEALAGQLLEQGADRSSLVIAFGGGIVTDVAGFVAATFMRGIPVLQTPTTLLAQVDAAIGGKTGVNLASGKNLVGAFHQPVAVVVDPDVLSTLSEREYRAGLVEVLKAGIIRDPYLYHVMADGYESVLQREPRIVDELIECAVKVKAGVVSLDERESGLRRILNFGHTVGHALEAETGYQRLLHGEAVAFGMKAAVHLSHLTGHLSGEDSVDMLQTIGRYSVIPPLDGVTPEKLAARLKSDKKTVLGSVHWVLAPAIGQAKVVSGIEEKIVLRAIARAME
ncbi:MAG TPA: 3-dehydroquinate synthase [Solibacterales bacterium]|nr:3-dehydroquinate synthase [Bryobacterales bacterium]